MFCWYATHAWSAFANKIKSSVCEEEIGAREKLLRAQTRNGFRFRGGGWRQWREGGQYHSCSPVQDAMNHVAVLCSLLVRRWCCVFDRTIKIQEFDHTKYLDQNLHCSIIPFPEQYSFPIIIHFSLFIVSLRRNLKESGRTKLNGLKCGGCIYIGLSTGTTLLGQRWQ